MYISIVHLLLIFFPLLVTDINLELLLLLLVLLLPHFLLLPTTTIAAISLTNIISLILAFKIPAIQLFFEYQKLEDKYTLSDYHIFSGATLELVKVSNARGRTVTDILHLVLKITPGHYYCAYLYYYVVSFFCRLFLFRFLLLFLLSPFLFDFVLMKYIICVNLNSFIIYIE